MNYLISLANSSRWHARALSLFAIVLAVEGCVAIFLRNGDTILHKMMGECFLQGNPYALGNDIYPPCRAMMNVLLALLPWRVTRVFCYGLAVLALVAVWRMWQRWIDPDLESPTVNRSAAFFALVFVSPILLRDLHECGLQIFTLFLLSVAGYALHRGRPFQAGCWLATATAYKVSPVFFLPFLLWKREWRAAAGMVLGLAFWALSPALFLGWDANIDAHRAFVARIQNVGAVHDAYPHLAEMEAPKPQNLGLQATLGRWLQAFPEGHPAHLDHPLFVEGLDLERETGYRIAKGMILAFGLALAWWMRRRWSGDGRDPSLAFEWAVVTMLSSLMGPTAWRQHLVVALPLVFLVFRHYLLHPPISRVALGTLAVATLFVLLPNHEVIGKENAILMLSYKTPTLALLAMLLLAILRPVRNEADGVQTLSSNAEVTSRRLKTVAKEERQRSEASHA